MGSKVKISRKSLVVKILDMIYKSGVCPETTPTQWVSTIFELHKKGMLYALLTPDHSEIIAAWAAYRIPRWSVAHADIIPKEDRGDFLYVPFFVSNDPKANAPLRALKGYLRENPNVREIIYYRRNDDNDLVRWKRKGVKHVEEVRADRDR